jgi:hypothetical protein
VDKIPYVNFEQNKEAREKEKSKLTSSLVQSNSQFVYMKNLKPDTEEDEIEKTLNENGFFVDKVRVFKPDTLNMQSEPTKWATIKMRNEHLG